MPDSIEETDVGHAGWISGCVLLFFLLSLPFLFKRKKGKRKKEEVTSQEFLAGNLLFYFSFKREKERKMEKIKVRPAFLM